MPFQHLLDSLGISTNPDATDAPPGVEVTSSEPRDQTHRDTPLADSADSADSANFADFDTGTTRRAARRAPVRGIASLKWRGGPSRVFGGLINVSPEGCLVKTESTIEEGTRVDIQLDFVGLEDDEERESVRATGVVRHRTEVEGRQAYGLEFTDETDRAVLNAYQHALN